MFTPRVIALMITNAKKSRLNSFKIVCTQGGKHHASSLKGRHSISINARASVPESLLQRDLLCVFAGISRETVSSDGWLIGAASSCFAVSGDMAYGLALVAFASVTILGDVPGIIALVAKELHAAILSYMAYNFALMASAIVHGFVGGVRWGTRCLSQSFSLCYCLFFGSGFEPLALHDITNQFTQSRRLGSYGSRAVVGS